MTPQILIGTWTKDKELVAEAYLSVKKVKNKDKPFIEILLKFSIDRSFDSLNKGGIITYFYNSEGIDFKNWIGKNFTQDNIKAELQRLQMAGFDIFWNKMPELTAQFI
jgi:hypothetical protein